MSGPDLSHRTVLVTGGTRGLGLAIGLELGRHGASVWLTHRWGSEDESALERVFLDAGAAVPEIVEADVSNPGDTARLFDRMSDRMERLDIFVSSASVVSRGGSLGALRMGDLRRSLEYSVWPTASYFEEARRRFGALPEYVIATSSDGADRHYPGYDYAALSKAALEALCRRLGRPGSGSKVFVLRARQVATGSYRDVFPEAAREAVAAFSRFELRPEEVGSAAVAIASGLLDGLVGAGAAFVTVDKGASFVDNVMTAAGLLESIARREREPIVKGMVELRGRSILVAGELTELGRFLADRFRVAGADVFLGPPAELDRALLRDRRLDAALVPLTHPDPSRGPFALVEALQRIAARQECYPRYAIGFCEGATGRDDDGVAFALATTLCRYLSAHTVTDDVRVNLVSAPLSRGPAVWESVADVGLALTSGLLDAMRGQVLEIPGGVA